MSASGTKLTFKILILQRIVNARTERTEMRLKKPSVKTEG